MENENTNRRGRGRQAPAPSPAGNALRSLQGTEFYRALVDPDLNAGFARWDNLDADVLAFMQARMNLALLLGLHELHRTVKTAGHVLADKMEDVAVLLADALAGANDDNDEGVEAEVLDEPPWSDEAPTGTNDDEGNDEGDDEGDGDNDTDGEPEPAAGTSELPEDPAGVEIGPTEPEPPKRRKRG